MEHFMDALKINPNSLPVYVFMGWTFFNRHDYVLSIENFHKATLLDRSESLPQQLRSLGAA